MKTYILVGSYAITSFQSEYWQDLEDAILKENAGELVAWDNEKDSVSELLAMLNGWENFIELSEQDLKDIEDNTKIEIDYGI